MRQHRHERIAHRANNALCHVRFREGKRGVHRSYHVIEFGEELVVEIERATAENIALDSGEESEIIEFAIELSDRGDLRSQPRGIEPARLDRAAAVIGDAEILQSERL